MAAYGGNPYGAPPPPYSGQMGAPPYGGPVGGGQGGVPFGGPAVPMPEATGQVELTLSCRKLINMDRLSKSDPWVRVYMAKNGGWFFLAQTEVIRDNLNPKFAQAIKMDYHFEELTLLQFRVYDVDDEKHLVEEKQDFIGEAIIELGEMVANGGKMTERPLQKTLTMKPPSLLELRRKQSMASLRAQSGPEQSKRGYMQVVVEELNNSSNDELIVDVAGKGLKKMDMFGKSDPFIVISKENKVDQTWVKSFESAVIKKTLNPAWPTFVMNMGRLCNGDMDRRLLVECFDWNSNGKHKLIGSFLTSAAELLQGPGTRQLDDPKKKGKSTGNIIFTQPRVQRNFSFIQYLQGGCEINFITAVDFTQSNGLPHEPTSLHYRRQVDFSQLQLGVPADQLGLNDYQSAIINVGRVLAQYDSDQLIPALGFGGRFANGQVSHCFNLNGSASADCKGVMGVMEAYNQALANVQLYGPTIFSEVIRYAATQADEAHRMRKLSYFVLLIITDGIITDMQQTIDEIVRASCLPLSIVIVGVGNADFSAMEVLDADDTPLVSSRGQKMSRDIVQFVPFNSFRNAAIGALASEVLHEIPGQLVSYMKSAQLSPAGMGV